MAAKGGSLSPLTKSLRKLAYKDFVIYILPNGIETIRLEFLKRLAKYDNYNIKDDFCDEVTHILTDLASIEEFVHATYNLGIPCNVQILSTKWLTDSVLEKQPIMEYHRLSTYIIKTEVLELKVEDVTRCVMPFRNWMVAICSNKCLLNHPNPALTDALDIIIKNAEHRYDGSEATNRALYKAVTCKLDSAIIKTFPCAVMKFEDLIYLPCIGGHSNKAIQEVLEMGTSTEVEVIKQDEWFISMELFTKVYGIGAKNAKKLYECGHRTIDDLMAASEKTPSLSSGKITCGLAFYEDLKRMTRTDADQIHAILQNEMEAWLPGTIVALTGGFRRGRREDVISSFIIVHHRPDRLILSIIIDRLRDKNIVLHSRITYAKPMVDPSHDQTVNFFEECNMVLRCPAGGRKWSEVEDCDENFEIEDSDKLSEVCKISKKPRQWKAVKVQLLLCLQRHFAYMLLWTTGSSFFSTCLRIYARYDLNMIGYNSGLWDITTKALIPAADEREAFANLKLDYLEPWERNM